MDKTKARELWRLHLINKYARPTKQTLKAFKSQYSPSWSLGVMDAREVEQATLGRFIDDQERRHDFRILKRPNIVNAFLAEEMNRVR